MNFFTFKIRSYLYLLITIALLATACGIRKTQSGAAIGAGAGATVGALIGKTAGNTALGTIIGGAIGGTAGAYIGHTMDLVVNYDREILFSGGSAELSTDAKIDLKKVIADMRADPKMNIAIVGYTDTLGNADYNMALSVKRAEVVKEFLVTDSISETRLITKGKGVEEPIATNDTPAGRAKNRRVEIVVLSNDKSKRSNAKL